MNRFLKRQRLYATVATSLVLGLFAMLNAPATLAQAQLSDLSGAPVDIHEGTCADYITEPAYDGGDVETAAIDDILDDEYVYDGLYEDDELGAYYVDLDDDELLDDDEFVGAVGGDVPVALAETEFGDDIDFAQQYVIALHAGADQYDTVLACGEIPAGEIDEAGVTVVDLDPVNNAGIVGYSVIEDDGGAIHTYLFQQGTAPASTPVTEPTVAEGLPVGIHRGTCQDWTTEPAYDVGLMEQTNVAAPGEQEAGATGDVTDFAGDDGIFDETDEGYLYDDLDDDGIFEIGFDADDDGIFDDDEVLGVDDDDDAILDDDELSVAEADTAFPMDFGPVYTVDSGTQFDGQELLDEGPYVVAVHESAENYGTLVACGPVVPIVEDDNVIVPMRPVGDSGWSGVFLINEDGGEIAGFLWQDQPSGQ